MNMRDLCFLSATAFGAALSGCVPHQQTVQNPPVAQAPKAEWVRTLNEAAKDPFYAGSYVSDAKLWVGFTRDAALKLGAITQAPDIGSFTAPYTATELDQAMKATVSLLDIMRFGPTSVAIDYRQGLITVHTAYSLNDNSGPTPACNTLTPLPAIAPGGRIPLRDLRDCRK